MYLEHFNMKFEPFAPTHDPRFLYLGEQHGTALERLVAAVNKRHGITAIIGEPGLGKSTLLRALLRGLKESVNFAWVFNTTMDSIDLLRFICRDFGFMPKSENKSDLLIELYTFFIREYEQDRIPLLIIDEAQNLRPEILEEIRQLSNLETLSKKLLQIILCGQPQLEHYLEMPELYQLKQRISFKAGLSPLSYEETVKYIEHRLKIAGALDVDIFSNCGLRTIHDISDGVPRLINHICDNALHAAAQIGMNQVKGALIRNLVKNGDVVKAVRSRATNQSVDQNQEKWQKRMQPRAQQNSYARCARQVHAFETECLSFEAIDISELLSVI